MREILIFPALTANCGRGSILVSVILSLFILTAAGGCGIKKQINVEVPQKILQARTATLDELLGIINNYERINNLSCSSIKLTLVLGKRESGELDKYKKAPGYLVLRRPDSIRLVVQEPIIKTPQLDLLSVNDDFSIFIRSRNEFYTGKNSAKELVAEDAPDAPEIPIRPGHLFKAILPQGISNDLPGTRIIMEEDMDPDANYYALSICREGTARRDYIVRRIWIERSSLTIARQRLFGEDGQILSDIVYSNMNLTDGFYLPQEIHMDRPQDGYTFDMEFNSDRWRVNSDLRDKAFILTPPEGSRIIHLTDKGRSDLL
jgi:hypothetical protein